MEAEDEAWADEPAVVVAIDLSTKCEKAAVGVSGGGVSQAVLRELSRLFPQLSHAFFTPHWLVRLFLPHICPPLRALPGSNTNPVQR